MSLRIFMFSVIDPHEVKGARLTLRGHTENPRGVHRSWDIPNRRKLSTPSKKDIHEDDRTSPECSELTLHG